MAQPRSDRLPTPSGLASVGRGSLAGASLAPLLASVGIALLGAAVVPDLRRGEGLGSVGVVQLLMMAAGVAALTGAVVIASPRGAAIRNDWEVLLSERTASLADVKGLSVVTLQLAAIVLFINTFRIENPVFYSQLMPMVVAAFVVHHFLPNRLRLWAFAALSLASVFLVFGARGGLWLVALGGVLIAAAHAPVSFKWRVALALAITVALGFGRAGIVTVPWEGSVWPILGSMFMYRLAVYMYDNQNRTTPVHWGRTVAYFFLLPNVAFPLFPVVDFATFRRSHYDQPALAIYQRGVEWMVRGVTHLLVYRLVYQYATLSPADVNGTADLVRYMVANFGLYLRVSGQFHLIVGTMHLFGFRLPETHRFFFLASSFSDLWRRINIYWKDFMQKLFFMPVSIRLRKYGETSAMLLGMFVVFVFTWFLHSYQWFWILGVWLFSSTDILFWSLLACLLFANAILEMRRGRTRALSVTVPKGRAAVRLGLQTAGTFAVMAFLWSLWTAPTLGDWSAMLRTATLRPMDILVVVGVLGVIAIMAVVSARVPRERHLSPASVLALALVPVGVVTGANLEKLGDHVSVPAREVLRDLRTAELNKQDAARLQRGYYEKIVGVNRFNGQLWELYSKRSAQSDKSLEELGVMVLRNDALQKELRPLQSVVFHGATLRTNRWGMRDQNYAMTGDPRATRVALLGQSYVMGSGVSDDDTFEAMLERRLNADSAFLRPRRFEMLNFAVEGYSLFQQLTILQNGRVAGFQPQVLMLVGHPIDLTRNIEYLVTLRQRGLEIPWPEMRHLVDSLGIEKGTPWEDALRRIGPSKEFVTQWALRQIASEGTRLGLHNVYAVVTTPNLRTRPENIRAVLALARDAGFDLLDISDIYDGVDEQTLWVAEWDRHPNTLGHQMIADRLYREIKARPSLIEGVSSRRDK